MSKNAITCEDICYHGLKVRVKDETSLHGTILKGYKRQGFLYVVGTLPTDSCADCSLVEGRSPFATIKKDNLEPILTFRGKEITCEDVCYKGMPVVTTDVSIIPTPECRDMYMKRNMMWVTEPFHEADTAMVTVYTDNTRYFPVRKDKIIPVISDTDKVDALQFILDRKLEALKELQGDIDSIKTFQEKLNSVKSFG